MATIKTIKVRRNPLPAVESQPAPNFVSAEAPEGAPAGEGATQATTGQPDAAVATDPIPVAVPKASGKSYMPYAVMASVVVVVFLVILGLQYSEISFYQASPSVWAK